MSCVIFSVSYTYIRFPKTYDLCRVRLNGLNEFNYAKYSTHTKRTKFVLCLREFPNGTFKNDVLFVCCQSYQLPTFRN